MRSSSDGHLKKLFQGKQLKEHSLVADMLSEVAKLIEAPSAWMWAYAHKMDHPEIYGWEPWDERLALKTRGLALHARSSVERACSRAIDFMGSCVYSREFDIEKHWRDQKMIGLWMGGKGLKTLENARYWYDLEILQTMRFKSKIPLLRRRRSDGTVSIADRCDQWKEAINSDPRIADTGRKWGVGLMEIGCSRLHRVVA